MRQQERAFQQEKAHSTFASSTPANKPVETNVLSPVNIHKSNTPVSPISRNNHDGFNASTLNGNMKQPNHIATNGLLGTNPLGPPMDRSFQVLLDKKDQTILELNDLVVVRVDILFQSRRKLSYL